MTCFNSGKCFAQSGDKVVNFVQEHFSNAERTLLISTLGIQPQSLFFPAEVFAKVPNLDIRSIVEKRRHNVPLESIGKLHRDYLTSRHDNTRLEFVDIEVIASDGATVGGRNAVAKAQEWYKQRYSDIVIDATGMSRGVCFPLFNKLYKRVWIWARTFTCLLHRQNPMAMNWSLNLATELNGCMDFKEPWGLTAPRVI